MNEITKDFFLSLGISEGMTVLDVGCGKGVTTELISEIVGDTGKVIGIDSNQNAIAAATFNAQSKNISNITYVCSDISDLTEKENEFDAILGRRVLMYLPNPKTILKELSKLLKPNGILGFQEHDSTSVIDKEKMPLHFMVNNWIWKLVQSNGGNTKIGQNVWDFFSNEFITIENIKSETVIQTPENNISLTPILQTLSGLLIAKNIVSKQHLLEDNLLEKLELEKKNSECVFIRELIFFISARRK